MSSLPPATVRVQLAGRGYDVVIGKGLLFEVGTLARALLPQARRIFIAHDNRPPMSGSRQAIAMNELAKQGFEVSGAPLIATETEKSLVATERLLAAMAKAKLERTDALIALGGGIVGDLAGFAAATYRRGIPVIQCPTTLLSMVDASVGGKTGVNLNLGTPAAPDLKKNAAGSFHQPILVLADIDSLVTLPKRHLSAGFAECIKHGLIGAHANDPQLLDWTASNLDAATALDPMITTELVRRNVAVKAQIVQGDEREEAEDGGRALLNLGHTFGHAIETLPDLSPDGNPANAPLMHGEAVGLGLVAAAACSQALGLCPAELVDQVRRLLSRCGLPDRVSNLPPDDTLVALMQHDKKARAGATRLILPLGNGQAKVVSDPPREAVAAGIAAIRK